MPLYDYRCEPCDVEIERASTIAARNDQDCTTCGTRLTRVFKTTAPVHGDDIPGGMTVENMGPRPMTFYSKTAWNKAMRERGLINRVQHTPTPGSDKSPHTTRWV